MSTTFFPKQSTSSADILSLMIDARAQDVDWASGFDLSRTYFSDQEHLDFVKKAHHLFFSEDAENPWDYKSLRQFEHETVRMCAEVFHGDRNVVGTITSHETEALLLMVKSYRDKTRKSRPWVKNPEMIIPESAHPAFGKVAEILDVKVIRASLESDFRVSIQSVKKLINRNTILLIGSAPQYPQGVVDPIAQLGEVALKHGIPLHVDASVGGFIIPFMEKLGAPVAAFDFRIPGVMSISADIHKYGYGCLGASVLLYRSMNTMKYQLYASVDWKGGAVYTSSGLAGVRSGGPIAAAWATMKKMGEEGYLTSTQKLLNLREHFLKELSKIPELKLLAHPDATLLAFTTQDPLIPILGVAKLMEKKGWHVEKQNRPDSLHLTLSLLHEKTLKRYFEDLKSVLSEIKADPALQIKNRNIISKSSVLSQMEKIYGPENKYPEETLEVESWSDFAQKMGNQALDVWDKFKTGIIGKP